MNTKTTKKVFRIATLALASLLAHGAMAYNTNGNVWPGSHPRVPFYVSDNLNGYIPYDGTYNDGLTAIQNAANEWNTHSPSEAKFDYVGTTSVNTVADDGVNAIIYDPGQCPDTLGGAGCFAICYYHQSNGVFHGFDIVLYKNQGTTNYQVSWAAKSTPLPWDKDLTTTALHELGHALGLGHSSLSTVVMSGGCGNGCKRRTLYADDINGNQAINGVYSNEGLLASTLTPLHGTTMTLSLNYPKAAGQPYLVTLTLSGMNGFPLNLITPTDSRRFATNIDFFPTQDYPTIFQNFFGALDGNGDATATIHLPNNPALAGLNLYFSAVTFDAAQLSGLEDLGVGVQVTIQ